MKKSIFLASGLLLGLGCSNGQNNSGPSKVKPDLIATTTTLPKGSVALDGVYATSVANGSDVLNLFDENPKTHWQARPGAGPNEGILIRFATPTQLTGLEASGTDGAFEPEGGLMDLSFDGKTLYQSVIGQKLDLSGATDGPVRELYIRITHTNLENALEPEIGPWFQPRNLPPVGFKSLRLFGDKGQELRLVAPLAQGGTVVASSSLAPGYAYGPERLFDSNPELAWVEGNKTNAGEGEVLEFAFEKPVRITALKLWNGYQRTPESFSDNACLNTFEFGIKNSSLQPYALKDQPDAQILALGEPLTGTVFQLRIKSVFPGKKYSDLALSELVFYNGEQPITLRSNPNTAETALRNRVVQTPLAEILNRGCRSISGSLKQDFNQLFTLRDDGTFSLQVIATTVDESETITVAAGHWELLEGTSTLAKVKITGCIKSTVNWMDRPTLEKTTLRTFSEIIQLDQNTLRGQKVVERFRFK